MINKTRWKLRGTMRPKQSETGLQVDSSAMVQYSAKCQICGKSLKVWLHRAFDALKVKSMPEASKRSENKSQEPEKGVEAALPSSETLIKGATCQPCFGARQEYIMAREDIEEVSTGLAAKWNEKLGGYKLDDKVQERWRNRLRDSIKGYIQAHGRMIGQYETRFHDDMYRAIWFKPGSWFFVVEKLDEILWTCDDPTQEFAWFVRYVNKVSGRDPVRA